MNWLFLSMEEQMFSAEYFMKLALREAENAAAIDEVPIGAVIVCQNQVIARAHNLSERLNDATAHAEMQALTAAQEYLGSKYLRECTLYVTLEPCVMCAGAAFWTKIGRIVFGAYDEKAGFSQFKAKVLHPKTKVEGGVLLQESLALMQSFFKSKRK